MKRNEAGSSSTSAADGRQSHALTFAKVLDGRKQPIRGLWVRNGRYYAQLSIENPVTGEKRVRRVPLVNADNDPVETVAQAVAQMERLKVKRTDNDLPVLRRTPKFTDYVKHYLDYIGSPATAEDDGQTKTKKGSTIAKEKTLLGKWVEHIGHLRVDQIKLAHVNGFTNKRRKDSMSSRTVNLDVIALRNCLKQARADGWIQRLPTEGLRPLKTTTRKRPLFASAELEKLCAAAFEQRKNDAGTLVPVTKNAVQFTDYIQLLAYSGARRNESLALRWQDVDFEQGQLTIGAGGDTKNSEARTVDFNPKLKAHLLDMQKRKAPDSDFLFPSPQRGEQNVSAKSFKESLGLVRTQGGMPKFNFHDCRHHFISMAVMSGVDYMTIAAWVGHKDGGVLIGKVYGHLANEHRQAMAEKMNFGPVVLEKEVSK